MIFLSATATTITLFSKGNRAGWIKIVDIVKTILNLFSASGAKCGQESGEEEGDDEKQKAEKERLLRKKTELIEKQARLQRCIDRSEKIGSRDHERFLKAKIEVQKMQDMLQSLIDQFE
ncbi:MAG TPA: hypothetical protein VK469_06050 [Candidatus Kapabacteria bacterium]|nr:hypothetical protein [Candidatus Kapabacteria bacterium]